MKKLVFLLVILGLVFTGTNYLYSQEESALGEEELIAEEMPQEAQTILTEKIFDYYTLEYPSAFIQKKGKMSASLILRNYQINRTKTISSLDTEPFSDNMSEKVTAYSILANFAVTDSIEVIGGFDLSNRNIPDPTGNTKFYRQIIRGLWGMNVVLKKWSNGSSVTAGVRYSTTDPDTVYLSAMRIHVVATKPYFGGKIVGNFGIIYNHLNSWLFQDKSNYFYNIELMGAFDFKLFQKVFVRFGFQEETTSFPVLGMPPTYMLAINYKPSDDYRFSFFYEKIKKSYINSNGAKFVEETAKNTMGLTLTFIY